MSAGAGRLALCCNFVLQYKQSLMQKITPFLWFNDNAEEAVSRYLEIFKEGRIGVTSRNPQTGKAFVISFSINGQQITAMNGGPNYQLSPAFSLMVSCETQEEVDYYWDTLIAGGGQASRCGWLTDPFGLSWQVIPNQLPALMSQPDPGAAQRVLQAMLGMEKIIIADLEAAATAR